MSHAMQIVLNHALCDKIPAIFDDVMMAEVVLPGLWDQPAEQLLNGQNIFLTGLSICIWQNHF